MVFSFNFKLHLRDCIQMGFSKSLTKWSGSRNNFLININFCSICRSPWLRLLCFQVTNDDIYTVIVDDSLGWKAAYWRHYTKTNDLPLPLEVLFNDVQCMTRPYIAYRVSSLISWSEIWVGRPWRSLGVRYCGEWLKSMAKSKIFWLLEKCMKEFRIAIIRWVFHSYRTEQKLRKMTSSTNLR